MAVSGGVEFSLACSSRMLASMASTPLRQGLNALANVRLASSSTASLSSSSFCKASNILCSRPSEPSRGVWRSSKSVKGVGDPSLRKGRLSNGGVGGSERVSVSKSMVSFLKSVSSLSSCLRGGRSASGGLTALLLSTTAIPSALSFMALARASSSSSFCSICASLARGGGLLPSNLRNSLS